MEYPYLALGFARLANYEVRWAHDALGGVVPVANKNPMLQCEGEKIKGGMSGAPILDRFVNRVVGMVSEYSDDKDEKIDKDSNVKRSRFAWATTSETLAMLNPILQPWPDTYGPDELNDYLKYLIDANQTLTLPNGRQVLLERVYVSLRADAINDTERQAEHDIYLEDVETFQKLTVGEESDQYARFTAIRKVIANRPTMLMLEARNWKRLFRERQQTLLSLAEVVQLHPHVVLLGDPGSGKTTLGMWLVLQFARALRSQKSKAHVQVKADLVQPGSEANRLIDLGPARLPIFIRIADYARSRWDKERGDTELPLEGFIGQQYIRKTLPSSLTPKTISAIAHDYLAQGSALVVLDGLDEVSDPNQRREVMLAVKKFIQAQLSNPVQDKWASNRVLLTSRVVGYQFDPLTHLPHYTVEDMDETAIALFCQAWMMHLAKVDDTEATEQAKKLKAAIFDYAHPSVQALAGNPLLLTILAQVYWDNAEHKLPTRRVALFDATAQALYDQRKDFWERVGIPPGRLTRALGAVAAYIHAHEVTSFAEEGTVRAQLSTILTDPEQVDAVLTAAREVSGFLVARGEGVYGFLH